jgi:hypothetical protein
MVMGLGLVAMLSSAIVAQYLLLVVRGPLVESFVPRCTKQASQYVSHAATEVYCVRKSINTFKRGFSAVGRKLCGKMLRNKARDHISFHIEYFYVSRLKTRHNR